MAEPKRILSIDGGGLHRVSAGAIIEQWGLIDRMDGNEEISAKLMNDDKFRDVVARHLLQQVYDQIRAAKLN